VRRVWVVSLLVLIFDIPRDAHLAAASDVL
jgi:hypothetical protein